MYVDALKVVKYIYYLVVNQDTQSHRIRDFFVGIYVKGNSIISDNGNSLPFILTHTAVGDRGGGGGGDEYMVNLVTNVSSLF